MSNEKPLRKTAEALMEADASIAKAVVPYRETPPVKALSLLSQLGDQPQARALSVGVFALGLIRRDRRLASAGARMLVAHEAATLAKNFVKHRVDRTRPRSHGNGESRKPEPGGNTSKEETSFPSGHSAGAAALARAFARDFPEHEGAAYAGAGVIALAQIPRCAHYATDVGSGIAIGVAAEAAASWLFDRTAALVDVAGLLLALGREREAGLPLPGAASNEAGGVTPDLRPVLEPVA
jgi:membrane-associated phospholipid phosphatase